MNVQRGDVVLIDYPYAAGGGTKVRPVLVIQNDRDNQRLLNTIVAQITSVTRRALEPTQLLIEMGTPEGQRSGLRQNSVVNDEAYPALPYTQPLVRSRSSQAGRGRGRCGPGDRRARGVETDPARLVGTHAQRGGAGHRSTRLLGGAPCA